MNFWKTIFFLFCSKGLLIGQTSDMVLTFQNFNLDALKLKGTIIGIPGINPISISNHKIKYIDNEDLNRNFPGKKHGNRSQQMAYQINEKVLLHFDFHADMHTACFGRVNSIYGRGDMTNDTLAIMKNPTR